MFYMEGQLKNNFKLTYINTIDMIKNQKRP